MQYVYPTRILESWLLMPYHSKKFRPQNWILALYFIHFSKYPFDDLFISGVKTVDVNRKLSLVTVNGYVDPNKVLKRVINTGKKAEFWPYVPYNVVQYHNLSQVYDKKAPAGYVKNVQAAPTPNAATEETMTYLFSDENPNACSIMWNLIHSLWVLSVFRLWYVVRWEK